MKDDRYTDLLNKIFTKVGEKDRAFLANIRNADSPNLRYLVYDILASYNIPFQESYSLPIITLGASIVRRGVTKNGTLTLGSALCKAFPDKEKNDSALQARLRRLLACDNSIEFCRILRGNLKLIEGRLDPALNLDYLKLFALIGKFNVALQHAREELAMDFYQFDIKKEQDDGTVSK